MKKRVLFLCTFNSVRSQMAEGLLASMYGGLYEAYSAGTKASLVNSYAIEVMAEIGIDISAHRSKAVDEFVDKEFDYVVTVCGNAKKNCPFIPGAKKHLHNSFKDPSSFYGDGNEILDCFRRVRDEIKDWINKTFG